jgi:hypothetical protein
MYKKPTINDAWFETLFQIFHNGTNPASSDHIIKYGEKFFLRF